MSVASGVDNAIITGDASTSKEETIASDKAVENTLKDSKGGLVFEITTDKQALTLGNTLTIEEIDGSSTHNAYSILVDSANTKNFSIKADSAQSIFVKALPTTTKADGKAYVYANNSANTVTFDKVNLAVNASAVSGKGTFGIYSGIDGAKFDFGSKDGAKTVFTGITASKGSGVGDSATGIFIADNTTLAGNLQFSNFAGQAGADGSSNVGSAGGAAFGIVADVDGKKLVLENANITFIDIRGGNGGNGDGSGNAGGVGGAATGISLTSGNSLTLEGSGKIIFSSVVGGQGGMDGDSANYADTGKSYFINNTNTASGKDLTISGISIIAGDEIEVAGTYGIYNNFEGAKYVFGKTAAKTVLKNYAQGMILKTDTVLEGNLNVINELDVGTVDDNNVGQENVTALVITGGNKDLGQTLKDLVLSVSSTNGNVTAVALQGSSDDTAKDLTIDGITLNADSLTAKDAEANKAIALSNTGKTNFTGVLALDAGAFKSTDAQKIILDNQGVLSFASVNALTAGDASGASVDTNSYAIFAGIADAQYNFGTSTSFADITNKTAASAGAAGKDAAAIYVGANSTISGNATFAAFAGQAGEATTGVASGWKKGGNGYAITTTGTSDVSLKFIDNATLNFGKITGGKGEKSTSTGGGAGGDAAGVYVNTANLEISGSGTITFAGFEGGKVGDNTGTPAKDGNAYIIQNASADKTLTLSGVSVIAGSILPATNAPAAGSYGIYNYFTGTTQATYLFGTKADGGTVLNNGAAATNSAGAEYTGMIAASNVYASGVLKVVGQNANGQEQASRAAGNGLKGGEVTGIKLVAGNFELDTLTLDVAGGNGSNGTAGSNVAGSGGDAYGIKAAGGSLVLSKGASTLKVVGGAKAGTGTGGEQGKAYGIHTSGDFAITGYSAGTNTLSLSVEGSEAYGIYLAGAGKKTDGSATVNAANEVNLGTLTFEGADTGNGAIKGTTAYGIYNKSDAWNKLSGTITFGGTSKAGIGDTTNTENAYGIYNAGKLELAGSVEFKDTALAAKTGDGKKVHLYNAGKMTFSADSKAFIGASADANLFADASKTLDVAMAAGSTTTFNGKAFGGTGSINLALNGEAGKTAKLVFNSDAGKINTLSGSNADIFLAGADQTAVKARFEAKTPFAGRTLQAKEADISNSHIVLAAKTTSALTPNAPGTFAGQIIDSDRIIVDADSSTVDAQRNNTLHVTVDQYVTERKDDLAILAVTDLRTTNISVNTDFVAPATAALSTGVSLFSANLNSLSKRMGELRNDPYSHGVWARVFGGEQTTDFGAKQSTVYSTIQAGYDYKLALDSASNYTGVAISYTKGSGGQVDPAYKQIETPVSIYIPGLSSSNTDGVEVALYNSYVAENGLYSDTIAKFGYYMSDLTMFRQQDPYSISNLAVAVSEEIGYKVKLGESNEWFITPQGEVAFAYMGGSDFTQSNGADSLKSSQDATSLLRARVGAAWGYDFSHLAKESNVKASIYLGTYYTYDYFIGGDTTLTANEGGVTTDYTHNAYEGTGRFVMNLGANIDVQESTKVYFDFEKSFGGKIQTDYQVSLGVRFGFGEKVSATAKQEKKASEAALKPKELEESAE